MLDEDSRDMGGGTPDLLITNYSMLEYILLRPIEQPLLDDTQTWLRDNPDEKLLIVMDEAHLYRGSGGAEVPFAPQVARSFEDWARAGSLYPHQCLLQWQCRRIRLATHRKGCESLASSNSRTGAIRHTSGHRYGSTDARSREFR